jgi:sulfite dehydrogenase
MRSGHSSRRQFIRHSAYVAASLAVLRATRSEDTVKLPFENGERPLVKYPQKRPLIRHTSRPPQLETPFAVFNEGTITPNDAFFVRYHLTLSPPNSIDPDAYKVQLRGALNTPSALTLADLRQFEQVEVVAVNQCSGNSRGFFNPRVPGGQLGHGAMGNGRWRGVRLADVLKKAGIKAGARSVTFNGLDAPLIPKTPDFVKALDIDQALDGEVLLASEMNGEPLPVLNGFPLRLVVPGYYGTYWVKHLSDIEILTEPYAGYWMNPAYRIPDNACACVEPGATPQKSIPIARFNVRSFITSLTENDRLNLGEERSVKGIAFDGGYGIREVLFSSDGGHNWEEANLGEDLGRYSFRPWSVRFKPAKKGEHKLMVKATNRIGQSQPREPLWNPAGYMRNVIETVKVEVV